MTTATSDLKQQLRDFGLRSTAPRLAVLELLLDADRPMTHTDIVEQLGQEQWDQATIYRNLVKFVEVGLARVASEVGRMSRYELIRDDPHPHPHFVCVSCGIVECMADVAISASAQSAWTDAIQSAQIQLHGICPECTAEKSN